jgi:hypothetical protein
MARAVTNIGMRACLKCGDEHPRNSFPIKSRRTGARWPYCNACMPALLEKKKRELAASHARQKARRRSDIPVVAERTTWLSTPRLALYLAKLQKRLCLEFHGPGHHSRTAGKELLALFLGAVGDREKDALIRELHRIIDGQRYQRPHWNAKTRVRLDSVDEWFCRAGMPWVLRELYPELWEPSMTDRQALIHRNKVRREMGWSKEEVRRGQVNELKRAAQRRDEARRLLGWSEREIMMGRRRGTGMEEWVAA